MKRSAGQIILQVDTG